MALQIRTSEINRKTSGTIGDEMVHTQNDLEGEVEPLVYRGVQRPRTFGSRIRSVLRRMVSSGRGRVITALIVCAVFIGIAYNVHLFGLGLSAQEAAQRQVASAVSAVSKLMILPKETPVMAVVQDAKTLASQQSFFANAQNGDQLLVFSQSAEAILYSPSRNIIVNVGPIQYGNSAQTKDAASTAVTPPPAASVSTTSPITVEIRNGTGKNGLGASVAQTLKSPTYSVVGTTDAKSTDYTETTIVNVAQKPAELAAINALAKDLKARVVTSLPSGEVPSSADVIIILGRQQ